MAIFRTSAILFAAMLATGTAHAANQPGVPQALMRVHDLASPFVEVWDRHAATSPAAFVQDFKSTIAARFPAFYGVDRYKGDKTQAERDQEIAAAYAEFPAMREAYVNKVRQFTTDLPQHVATFRAVFPDYEAKNDLYFVHSLGEMDGGKRRLDGRLYYIFGADMMVKLHGSGNEAAFFHHELFHDYQVLDCPRHEVWVALWAEGLASYVSKAMNPSATEAEMLLDFPRGAVAGTRREMGRALDDLRSKLEQADDGEAYSGLFLRRGDKTGLPARRGYYLGFLVAEEAARKYTLQQMAKFDCGTARDVVYAAVESLRSAHAGAAR